MIELDMLVEAGGWLEAGPWQESELEAVALKAAEAALAQARQDHADKIPGEPVQVTLMLADDPAIRELNRTWRGLDKPTNVLSFPSGAPAFPGEPRPLGDIALAFETVAREAAQERKTLADHLAHLIVHGMLHLVGFDHETEAEAEIMEAIEVAALARLGVADPYAGLGAPLGASPGLPANASSGA